MISLISAVDNKRGIGKNGGQPWNIPEDEKFFNDATKQFGGVVVMGHTTYQVIGKPLSGRKNLVVSHDLDLPETEDLAVVNNLDEYLDNLSGDVWVIGGQTVFDATIMRADELYITEIAADFGCDRFFPLFEHRFRLKHQSDQRQQNGFRFRYKVYVRQAETKSKSKSHKRKDETFLKAKQV
jgi:dihydrofolate reductase